MISQFLARQYTRFIPKEKFIAVTGSIGKTSTVLASFLVLSQKFKASTTLKINPSIKKIILEMGDLSILKSQTVIVTKISNEDIQETSKLLEGLESKGVVILNWDDPNCRKLAAACGGTVVYYGCDSANCMVWAGNIKIENFRTNFELNLGVERVKIDYQLLGTHQIYPALAAATLGVINDVPLTKIKFALEQVKPIEHHLQALPGPNGSVILDDSYDSVPQTVDGAIDTLMNVPARRRILVLGEMRNLGSYLDQLHRQIAQKIYKEKPDFVFLGQGDAQIIAEELKSLGFWDERLEENLQNSKIVGKLLKLLGKGDVCLIKGSRLVRLDEVVKRIVKKS